MPTPDEIRLALNRAFAHPAGLGDVLEHFGRIDPLLAAGDLTEAEAFDLKGDAFRAMREATADDPTSAERPMLEILLPHCLLHLPGADVHVRYAISTYREELGRWLDSIEGPRRSALRERYSACWSARSPGRLRSRPAGRSPPPSGAAPSAWAYSACSSAATATARPSRPGHGSGTPHEGPGPRS